MGIINKLVISWVDANHLEGDVYFPDFDLKKWTEITNDFYSKSEANEFAFKITEYIKK